MRKGLIYLALIAALFVSCEEYYTPEMDETTGILVVESRLTNDPAQNFVKLSMTRDFYSSEPPEKISRAQVDLIEIGGQSSRAFESQTGYYTFQKTPVTGRTYQLRITYMKKIYESELAVMPPLPHIDTLYTKHKIEKQYRTDAFGNPELVDSPGREICIDAPITDNLEYYRFGWQTVLLWFYNPPSSGLGPPPPPLYGWKSRFDGGLFNLAGPKEFSTSGFVRRHPVLSLSYNTKAYLDSSSQSASGWIIIINQYGITKKSHEFHEKLNKQFAAEGSLFDPVLTQVYGNIHCTTDPSKIALGFFDITSYRQYRYYLNLGYGSDSQVIQRRLNRYPEIPRDDYVTGERPYFWENNY